MGGLFVFFILFIEFLFFLSYIIGSFLVWFKENLILVMVVKLVVNIIKVYIVVGEFEESEGEKMVLGVR